MRLYGLQLLQIHHYGSVAGVAYHLFAGVRDCRPYGGGKVVAHRGVSGVQEHSLPFFRHGALAGAYARRAVCHDEYVVGVGNRRERAGEVVDVYGGACLLPVFGDVFKGVFRTHSPAVLRPFAVGAESPEPFGERGEELAQVGVDRQVGLYERLLKLRGVDVHGYLERFFREIFPVVADLPHVVARAQKQRAVGVLQNEIRRALPRRPDSACGVFVAGGQDVVAVEGGGYRNVGDFRKLREVFNLSGEPHSVPGDYQRAFGGQQPFGDFRDFQIVGGLGRR